MKRIVQSRKLLIASVGVATVLYACEKNYPPGNLMAPEPAPIEAGMVTSGNLVAPPPEAHDASPIVPIRPDGSAIEIAPPGNLMPPPPPDAGKALKPAKPHPEPTAHPPGNLMPPPPRSTPKPL